MDRTERAPIVARALKAYRFERGDSDQAALQWANDHLNEALNRFYASMDAAGNRGEDDWQALESAWGELKLWAQEGWRLGQPR